MNSSISSLAAQNSHNLECFSNGWIHWTQLDDGKMMQISNGPISANSYPYAPKFHRVVATTLRYVLVNVYLIKTKKNSRRRNR